MAARKNYYAVKKGKITGIFSAWEECKNAVDGYPGAAYKGFATLTEAREYLGDDNAGIHSTATGGVENNGAVIEQDTQREELPGAEKLLVYVDGSYEDSISRYAFGCVFLLHDGRIYTACGSGNNEQSLRHRNVTGEMLGAMYAVKTAMMNGYKSVELRYDYRGIEKWVTGEWRSKTELTQKYAAAMREWSRSIQITFTKVMAHTNVKYNELADRMAKKGLESEGIPRVKKLEEMELYDPSE